MNTADSVFSTDEERTDFYIALPVIALFGLLSYYFMFASDDKSLSSPISSETSSVGNQVAVASSTPVVTDKLNGNVSNNNGANSNGANSNAINNNAVNNQSRLATNLSSGASVSVPSTQVSAKLPTDLTANLNTSESGGSLTAKEALTSGAIQSSASAAGSALVTANSSGDDISVAGDVANAVTSAEQGSTKQLVADTKTSLQNSGESALSSTQSANDLAASKIAESSSVATASNNTASVEANELVNTNNETTTAISAADQQSIRDAGFSIQFSQGQAVLTDSSRELLLKVAAVLAKYPNINLEAHGFTDSSGSVLINKQISQNRAQACIDVIASAGIDVGRLKAIGFGPEQPIASNETLEGRQANRRVEFKLIQ